MTDSDSDIEIIKIKCVPLPPKLVENQGFVSRKRKLGRKSLFQKALDSSFASSSESEGESSGSEPEFLGIGNRSPSSKRPRETKKTIGCQSEPGRKKSRQQPVEIYLGTDSEHSNDADSEASEDEEIRIVHDDDAISEEGEEAVDFPVLPKEIQELYEMTKNGKESYQVEDDPSLLKYSKRGIKVFMRNFVVYNSGEDNTGQYGEMVPITYVPNRPRDGEEPDRADDVALAHIIGQVFVEGEKNGRFWTLLPLDNYWWENKVPGFTSKLNGRDGDGTLEEIWYYLEDPHQIYKEIFEKDLQRHEGRSKTPERRETVISELVSTYMPAFNGMLSAEYKEDLSPRKEYKTLELAHKQRRGRSRKIRFYLNRQKNVATEYTGELREGDRATGRKCGEIPGTSGRNSESGRNEETQRLRIGEIVRQMGDPIGTYKILDFREEAGRIRAHLLRFIHLNRIIMAAPPNELIMMNCELADIEALMKPSEPVKLKVLETPTEKSFKSSRFQTESLANQEKLRFVRVKGSYGLVTLNNKDIRLIKGLLLKGEECHLCRHRREEKQKRIPILKTLGSHPLQDARLIFGGEEYRIGDCIFLSTDCVEKRVEAPKRFWMELEQLNENLKKYYADPIKYPEFWRWLKSEFPEPTAKPFQAARIIDLKKKKENGNEIIMKVHLFYRLADTTLFGSQEKLIKNDHPNALFMADEDTPKVILSSRTNVIKGRCHVLAVDNVIDGEKWVLGGPNRFFCQNKVKFDNDEDGEPRATVGVKLTAVMGADWLDSFNQRANRAPGYVELGNRKLPTLEVFAGAGGLAEGFRNSGVSDPKWAIEHWEPAAKSFQKNFPQCQVFQEDANVLLYERLEANKEEILFVDPEKKVLPEKCEVKMIVGGPPCQGFSLLNQNKNNKKSRENNEQVPLFLSIVDEYRPEVFLLENVEALGSVSRKSPAGAGLGRPASAAILCLLEMGYQVNFGVLQAGAFGVPQSRNRFFIMATAPWVELPKFPENENCFSLLNENGGSLNKGYTFEDLLERAESFGRRGTSNTNNGDSRKLNNSAARNDNFGVAPYRKMTVYDAISDLPVLIEAGHGIFDGKYSQNPLTFYQTKLRGECNTLTCHESETLSLIEKVRVSEIPKSDEVPGANWLFLENSQVEYKEDGVQKWTQALDYSRFEQRVGRHHRRVFCDKKLCEGEGRNECRILRDSPKDTLIPSGLAHNPQFHMRSYARVDPGTHCATITTAPKLSNKMGTVLHYDQDRKLTPREFARLMGFPDRFLFLGSPVDQYKQIGNAVPPPLAEALGRSIAQIVVCP